MHQENDIKLAALDDRIDELATVLDIQDERITDLLEYLVRTDPNFEAHTDRFDNWQIRLRELRHVEAKEKQLRDAKKLLTDNEFIVVRHENEIDAAIVKQWVASKKSMPDDDDLPF